MTDKIKEFIEQAGIYPGSGQDSAEILVNMVLRECLKEIEKNYVGAIGTYAGCHNTAVKRCSTNIKDRFGIEE
jgi:hypothetical protein